MRQRPVEIRAQMTTLSARQPSAADALTRTSALATFRAVSARKICGTTFKNCSSNHQCEK